MRTTLAVDDQLLRAAKRRARERGQTLGQLVEDALRRELTPAAAPTAAVPVPIFRGRGGPHPGIDATSNRALREALDADRELSDLR